MLARGGGEPPGEAMLVAMPISTEHVGRRYPAEPVTVTAQKIREFADALGDPSPAYRGPDAIAPPTFAITLASFEAVLDDPELELALERTIHMDQSFELARPLRAGDVVLPVASIEKVRSRGATDMITVAITLDTADGEHVATATANLFHSREEDA